MPNSKLPFELETYESGCSLAVVLIGGILICYHSELLHGEMLEYTTNYKEIFSTMKELSLGERHHQHI
jgi:hypothetical protein